MNVLSIRSSRANAGENNSRTLSTFYKSIEIVKSSDLASLDPVLRIFSTTEQREAKLLLSTISVVSERVNVVLLLLPNRKSVNFCLSMHSLSSWKRKNILRISWPWSCYVVLLMNQQNKRRNVAFIERDCEEQNIFSILLKQYIFFLNIFINISDWKEDFAYVNGIVYSHNYINATVWLVQRVNSCGNSDKGLILFFISLAQSCAKLVVF